MAQTIEIPVELARFELPDAVQARLQFLLDRQDDGVQPPPKSERRPQDSSSWPSSSRSSICVPSAPLLLPEARYSRPTAPLVGTTATGRATVAALALNRPILLAIRAEEAAFGRHPPR